MRDSESWLMAALAESTARAKQLPRWAVEVESAWRCQYGYRAPASVSGTAPTAPTGEGQ